MKINKNLKLNLKNKIIASSAGFIAIILCLAYYIVIPTIQEIKAMGNNIEEQREDLEKKYIKGQSLRQLMENFEKIDPKLTYLDKIFANQNRELEFITSLENEANKNQIRQKITLSSPQKTTNQKFTKIKVRLTTEGEFVKQLKYLRDLESLSYYINIISLELSSARRGGQTAPNYENSGQETSASENKSGPINLSAEAETYWE